MITSLTHRQTAPSPIGLANDFWQTHDRILLAPMEGVVDSITREILTADGAIDLCVTEFIRVTDRVLPAAVIHRECPELLANNGYTQSGTPVLVQLLGGQAQPIAETAALAAELGAVGIDLNFGCPAKTVNRHDGGATLLKNPERLHQIIAAVRKAVPAVLTVSAKVRLGFHDKDLHTDIAQAVAAGGASWLTVHARTRDEGYRPPAHWQYIARMREVIDIPVIANGEIWTQADYCAAREISGCRHVMIGRGLIADPDLASDIKRSAEPTAQRRTAEPAAAATWSMQVERLHRFAEQSKTARHEGFAVARLKQWLKNMSRRWPEARAVFEIVKTCDTLEPMLQKLSSTLEVTSL